MTGARWISATVLLLFLSAICGCGLATQPATRPKTDIRRYYLTVRVVDYDKETPVSDVSVQVVPSSCSSKDRALDASRGEKIQPSGHQSTGPQGTVLFALSVDRKLSASLKILISARFNPENVEDCKNTPLIEPICSYYWNPIEQGDTEFRIVKPALRIVPSVTEQSAAPRGSVHVTTRILNLAPYPVDFSVLANQEIPTTQPLSEGRLESEMSTEWSTEVSPPPNGWTFGPQSISVYCCQIDEEEKWLNMVNASVSFNVPSSQ
jgi:hypothetical protein